MIFREICFSVLRDWLMYEVIRLIHGLCYDCSTCLDQLIEVVDPTSDTIITYFSPAHDDVPPCILHLTSDF